MATRHSDKTLELKVGGFVLVGPRGPGGACSSSSAGSAKAFRSYYPLLVKFPDASGLLKGSDVLLAGAKIGHVSGGPRLRRIGPGCGGAGADFRFCENSGRAADFTVGSSGLLG